jgi:hypothetical protein
MDGDVAVTSGASEQRKTGVRIKLGCVVLAVALGATNGVSAQSASPSSAVKTAPPSATISNGLITSKIYLPDREHGYYQGTRFDWAGVIASLEYRGHNYYGPWFTKSDPAVHDYVFDGPEIVAGTCGTISGPVEEFSTDGKALGYDQAPPGGTFFKIGVGVLRKPEKPVAYSPYTLYEIVDGGSWHVRATREAIEFAHTVADPTSGYAYHYEKTLRLVPGLPVLLMEHRLQNTGKRTLATSVYNHNFLVLDGQTTGPDFVVKMPFAIRGASLLDKALAEARDHQIVLLKKFRGREVLYSPFKGFGTTAADYQFTIENKKVGAGVEITGDRRLSKAAIWSIRSVLSIEPFVSMTIDPGQEFSWKYTYRFYVQNGRSGE